MAGAPRSPDPAAAQSAAAPGPAPWRARRLVRGAAVRGALLLLGLLVTLLLAEGAVRIFGHEGPIYTFRDPEVGRRYTRSWAGEVYVEEARQVVAVAFNREGLRDRDWPARPPRGVRRVAVLGDSMVAALATPASERFTSLAAPASGDGGPLEVMNWGVAGSSPSLELRLYERRVRSYRPADVILAWFEGNDLSDDYQPLGGRRQAWMQAGPEGRLEHVALSEGSSALSEWLARHSRLYVWQNRILARLRGDHGDGALRPGLGAFDATGRPEVEAAWAFQAQVLSRFAAEVRADGGRFAVLHLPTPEAVYDDLWAGTVEAARAQGLRLTREAPEQRLRALCAAAAIPFRSAAEALRRGLTAPPGGAPERLFWNGNGHLDADGHRRVASELRGLLDELARAGAR